MTSIARQVWKAIESDVIVRRAIEKNIVSLKNLCTYLIKHHKIDATAQAIISAIRRYKEEIPLENKYERAKEVISQSKDIRITTNINEIAIEKNVKNQRLLQKAFDHINYDKGELLLINQGERSIKLMTNEKNMDGIASYFPSEEIQHIEKDIAEINISLADEAVRTPGIIATFSTELMVHDVNMVEIMSCVPEMLIFVKQDDVVKAYEILFAMCGLGKSQEDI